MCTGNATKNRIREFIDIFSTPKELISSGTHQPKKSDDTAKNDASVMVDHVLQQKLQSPP